MRRENVKQTDVDRWEASEAKLARIEALLDESRLDAGPVQIGVDKWVPVKWLRSILDGDE